MCSGILESTKEPYENRVWLHYQGQLAPGFISHSMMMHPDKVARILDGGATQLYQYEYNARGRVTKSIDPLGRETDFSYDDTGVHVMEVRQQRTGGGSDLLSSATYNTHGQVLTMTDGAGQVTTMTYDDHGQIKTVKDALERTTTFAYNDDGYGTAVTGSQPGVVLAMTHDGYGRVAQVTDSDGYAVQMEYDLLDRPTRRIYPDGTHEETTYSVLQAEWIRDRAGRWSHNFYNALGQLIGVEDPAYRFTRYDWCRCGDLKQITDPLGRATIWHHDAQGRVVGKDYPDGTSEVYGFEALSGRLSTATDALGQQTQYQYYRDNAVASVRITSPVGRAAVNVSYTYAADYARPASLVDSEGTTAYSYVPAGSHGAGRIAAVNMGVAGDTATIAYTYSYDALGRATSQKIDGVESRVEYDDLGRVNTVTNPLGTFNWHYDGMSGRVTTLDYPNGQHSAYSYLGNVGDWRLGSITNTAVGGGLLSSNEYTYDVARGLIAKWSQQRGAAPQTALEVRYDSVDQLIDARQSDAVTHAESAHHAFAYDAAGNRTGVQFNEEIATETPNRLNQLIMRSAGGTLQVRGTVNEAASVTVNGSPAQVTGGNVFEAAVKVTPGVNQFEVKATDGNGNQRVQKYQVTVPSSPMNTLSYDAVGNLISQSAATSVTYEWDAGNRMVAINAGTHRTEFGYNGAGLRVKITEKENGVVTESKRLVWDGTTLCEERNATGTTVTKRYCGWGEQVVGGAAAGNYYYAKDHLGSVREVTDDACAVRARYDYDPWGKRSENQVAVNPLQCNIGFTGHYYHAQSDLHLAPYRAYSAGWGRWLSRDPIAEGGGFNLYVYVGASPVSSVDLLGLATRAIGIAGSIDMGLHLAGSGQISLSWNSYNPFDWKNWRIGFIGSIVPLTGLSTAVGASVGVLYTTSCASTSDELSGGSWNVGGSVDFGLALGYEKGNLGSKINGTNQAAATSDNFFVGAGFKISPEVAVPLPAEVHGGYGWTWTPNISLGQINNH